MSDTFFYYAFHVLGFAVLALYILFSSGKFGLSIWKSMILCVASYTAMYGWMLLLKFMITGTGGQNAIRAYGFLPAFTLLFSEALGTDYKKSMDLLAPAPCIVQGVSHFGCLFPGCCYSWIQVRWGIYSKASGETLFPVQICESVTALLIALWMILRQRKKEYVPDGLDMPRMMILFGFTRFLWEFLRDNKKIFWGISELALWALGMAVVGTVWIIITRRNNSHLTPLKY